MKLTPLRPHTGTMISPRKLLLLVLVAFSTIPNRAAEIQLWVSNANFEDQGDTLDGDHDIVPLAQDPSDYVLGTVPGWVAGGGSVFDPDVGVMNPNGAGNLGFSTTAAHSGNLVMRVDDEASVWTPIRSEDGAAFLLGVGDTITVSGWIVEGRGGQTDIRFELYRLEPWPEALSGFRENNVASDHVYVTGSEWSHFSLIFHIGESQAAYAGSPLAFGFDSESSMLLDDLSLSVERVPEPSTALLLSVAAPLAFRRRARLQIC